MVSYVEVNSYYTLLISATIWEVSFMKKHSKTGKINLIFITAQEYKVVGCKNTYIVLCSLLNCIEIHKWDFFFYSKQP